MSKSISKRAKKMRTKCKYLRQAHAQMPAMTTLKAAFMRMYVHINSKALERFETFSRPLGLSAVCVAALVFSGCACTRHTSGRPIMDAKVSQIEKGKTTLDEVIALFGAPTTQSEMAGNTLYTYRYAQTKDKVYYFPYAASGDSVEEADELTITFDKTTGTAKTFSM